MSFRFPLRLMSVAVLSWSGAALAQETLSTIPVEEIRPVEPEPTTVSFVVDTAGGFSIETSDGKAGFAVEGRASYDFDFFDGIHNVSGDGDFGSESEFRRVRFGFNGWYTENWHYEFLIDVSDGDRDVGDTETTIDTASLHYTGFKYANINIGRYKRPVGLEILTSSNWRPFNENAIIWDLAPDNNTTKFSLGASKLFDLAGESHFLYQVAMSDTYREDQPEGTGIDRYAFNGRAVFMPVVAKGRVMHFGLSYADQNPGDGETTRIRSRFGVHAAERSTLVDTMAIDGDSQYGLEFAMISGPVMVSAEYIDRSISGADGAADVTARGYYVTAGYTLTGESRGYKIKDGRLDKIKPANTSYGAIELLARAQSANVQQDMGGADVDISSYSLGATWYPISAIKVMLEYSYTTVDGLDTGAAGDDGQAVTTRLQWVW